MRNKLLSYGKYAAAALAAALPSALAQNEPFPPRQPKQTPTTLSKGVETAWAFSTNGANRSLFNQKAGFTTASKALSTIGLNPEQATALKEILVIAGLIGNATEFDQKYKGGEGFSGRKQCAASLLKLVDETQKCLSQRTSSGERVLERWETQSKEWMENPAIHSLARDFGIVDEISPSVRFTSKPTLLEPAPELPSSVKPFFYKRETSSLKGVKGPIAVVLGSTYPTMLARCKEIPKIQDFLSEDEPLEAIILLGGARKAGKIDGTPEELSIIASDFGIDVESLTETHLIQYALNQAIPDLLSRGQNVVVIDTLASGIARPTTKTTMIEFTKWTTANPEISGAYFISKQPHALYQAAVIAPIMAEYAPWLAYEVVGPAASHSIANKSLLEAMASLIWVKMPQAIQALDLPITDEAIPLAQRLYNENPIIDRIIEASGKLSPEEGAHSKGTEL